MSARPVTSAAPARVIAAALALAAPCGAVPPARDHDIVLEDYFSQSYVPGESAEQINQEER